MKYDKKAEQSRLMSKCDINSTTGCWIWTNAVNPSGYGTIAVKDQDTGKWKTFAAHRFSYELFKEPIEKGKVVRHLCNNRRCCNPDHLDIGTHQDNMDDKALSIMNARDQYEQDMNYLTDLLKIKTKTKFNRFLVRFVVENADEDRLIAEYFRYTA